MRYRSSELGGGNESCGETLFNNRIINSTHQSVSHFLVEWLLEFFVWIYGDSQIVFDPADRLNAFDA